jgi:hypothetical protein
MFVEVYCIIEVGAAKVFIMETNVVEVGWNLSYAKFGVHALDDSSYYRAIPAEVISSNDYDTRQYALLSKVRIHHLH